MKKLMILFAAAAFSAATLSACNGTNSPKNNTTEMAAPEAAAKVEVIYFHGKQRCKTCIAIEQETKAVVESELADLVRQGKVKMRIVDISTKEGQAIAKKYKVTFSSLFVVTNPGKGEKAEDLTDFAFANARSHADVFRKELKAKIMKGIK